MEVTGTDVVHDDDDDGFDRLYNYEFRDPQTPLTPEQLELRKLVLKQAEYEPDAFYMGDWELQATRTAERECKTTRCLAGWAQYFARGAVYTDGLDSDADGVALPDSETIPPVDQDAIALLGITREEFWQHGRAHSKGLFFTSNAEALVRLRLMAAEPQ